MNDRSLNGVQYSYIEQLGAEAHLRLIFQLGREAGLAEARALQDGMDAERERRAENMARIEELLERGERERAVRVAAQAFQEDTRPDHVPAVSTPTVTVSVDPKASADDVAAELGQLWRPATDPPTKETAMPTSKSPTHLKPGNHLVGDHTTVTYSKEPEKNRPKRIGDVIMVTAAGRQVEIRLTPSGRKAKVYVDGTEIEGA